MRFVIVLATVMVHLMAYTADLSHDG